MGNPRTPSRLKPLLQVLRPVAAGFAEHQEERVQQRVLGVIAQGLHVGIGNGTTRLLDDALGRGGIPLRGGAKARVDVGRPFCNQAKLQRAAHADHFVLTDLLQEGIQGVPPVGTAANDQYGSVTQRPYTDLAGLAAGLLL